MILQTAMIAAAAFRRRRFRFDLTMTVDGGEPTESVVSIYDDGTATVEVVRDDGEPTSKDPQFSLELAQFLGHLLQQSCDDILDSEARDYCRWGQAIEELVGSADELLARFDVAAPD